MWTKRKSAVRDGVHSVLVMIIKLRNDNINALEHKKMREAQN